MLREDEADGADDEDLAIRDVLLLLPPSVRHDTRMYNLLVRDMLELIFLLAVITLCIWKWTASSTFLDSGRRSSSSYYSNDRLALFLSKIAMRQLMRRMYG